MSGGQLTTVGVAWHGAACPMCQPSGTKPLLPSSFSSFPHHHIRREKVGDTFHAPRHLHTTCIQSNVHSIKTSADQTTYIQSNQPPTKQYRLRRPSAALPRASKMSPTKEEQTHMSQDMRHSRTRGSRAAGDRGETISSWCALTVVTHCLGRCILPSEHC